MAGNEQKAIMGPVPASSSDADQNTPQPRQPSNLQGLLRFAMDSTQAENAPSDSHQLPLDDERKKFLDDALKSMTLDVIALLQRNVQTLRNSDTLPVDADVSEYMDAFDTILEHVDRLDTAIDFHKIGGFALFAPCFNSVHSCIRAGACDLLAEVCQHNPYCQRVVAETALMGQILNLVDGDADEAVQIKALYAVSCNVRQCTEGFRAFRKNDGLNVVCRALQRPIDKLRTKATFLLACCLSSDGEIDTAELRAALVQMDIVPMLISLLGQHRMPSHEHLVSLLCTLVTSDAEAAAQCGNPRYNCRDVLRQHLQLVQGREEYREEQQHCTVLLDTVFQGERTDADR